MWSPETKARVLERIAAGESVRQICSGPDMPSRETVRLWLLSEPDFLAIHARARELQAEVQAERMEEVEERVLAGEIDPNAARVVLGSMQWRTERMAPKRWGSKVEHAVTGELTHKVSRIELVPMGPK